MKSILILLSLTALSNALELSEIDRNAFGSTLMNAVSLQLKLKGPTDKLITYLDGLKESLNAQNFDLLRQELEECHQSMTLI